MTCGCGDVVVQLGNVADAVDGGGVTGGKGAGGGSCGSET